MKNDPSIPQGNGRSRGKQRKKDRHINEKLYLFSALMWNFKRPHKTVDNNTTKTDKHGVVIPPDGMSSKLENLPMLLFCTSAAVVFMVNSLNVCFGNDELIVALSSVQKHFTVSLNILATEL